MLLLGLRLCLRALFLFVLRVRRDKRPEKQKQGNGVGKSNELHSNSLLKVVCYWLCTQATSPDSKEPDRGGASYFLVS